jgi:predicted HicB family RNase H-like nuclease
LTGVRHGVPGTPDDEAGIFHGEVVDTRDVITFQDEALTS